MDPLSHFDEQGRARMVDVSNKDITERTAVATGTVSMKPQTLRLIKDNRITKGDVAAVARIAGIMAAKQTPSLIPLCHPLPLTSVQIDIELDETNSCAIIKATTTATARTGVEMEALTAVATTALTIYDMCKAVDKEMIIGNIMLVEKQGGKSGTFKRQG